MCREIKKILIAIQAEIHVSQVTTSGVPLHLVQNMSPQVAVDKKSGERERERERERDR